jgi:hypothetical protein
MTLPDFIDWCEQHGLVVEVTVEPWQSSILGKPVLQVEGTIRETWRGGSTATFAFSVPALPTWEACWLNMAFQVRRHFSLNGWIPTEWMEPSS